MTTGGDGAQTPPDPASPGGQTVAVQILAWLGAVVFCLAFAGGVTWLGYRIVAETPDVSKLFEPGVHTVPPQMGTAPPPPPVRAADGTMVSNPSWRVRPAPLYPASAMDVSSGVVEMQCRVTTTGQLDACVILAETPAGYGFGQAALAATQDASLNPRTVNGVAQAGKIRFALRFALR